MITRFIGDVHGKFTEYVYLTDGVERSVQVGDFGIGFGADYIIEGAALDHSKHRFIRGNHDDPARCKTMPGWIPDGTIEDGILYVGGAWSIDHALRIEGCDWWPDEQVPYEQWQDIIEAAEKAKIRGVVSHDCPSDAIYWMFGQDPINTVTGSALRVIRHTCRPEFWVHGHWHRDRDEMFDGTRFIALGELSYIDLEI